MKWPIKQPTKPAFYWYWDENRPVILEVRDRFVKAKMLDVELAGRALGQYDIATYKGEWYGLLKEPR